MKTIPRAMRGLAVVLAFCMSGCESSFTAQLWKTERFRHYSQPAPDPAVAVFYSPRRKDYLVAYDATDGFLSNRRNYYLGENVEQILDQKRPRFASTLLSRLEPVPVNQGTNVLPSAQAGNWVTIHTDLGQIGPYPLPKYEDRRGTAIQVALTPVAVVGDVALVSLIVAVAAGIGVALGSCVNCSR
jgi:hypothetical protein